MGNFLNVGDETSMFNNDIWNTPANYLSTYSDQQKEKAGQQTDDANKQTQDRTGEGTWYDNAQKYDNPWNLTAHDFNQSFNSAYGKDGLLAQGANANQKEAWKGIGSMAQGVIDRDGNPTYQSQGFIGANNYLQGVVNGTNSSAAGTLSQDQLAQGQSNGTYANGVQGQYNRAVNQYQDGLQGTDFLNQTASGNYSNPYLDATFNQASQAVNANYLNNVVPTTNSTAQSAGRYGSNAHNTQMGADTAAFLNSQNNLATQIYGGAYSQERQNQVGAQSQQANLYQGSKDTTLGARMTAGNQGQQNNQFNATLGQGNNQFNAGQYQTGNIFNATQGQQNNQFNMSQQMNAAGMAPAMDTAGYAGLDRLQSIGNQQWQQPWTAQQNAVGLLGVAGGVSLQRDPNEANHPSVIQGAIGGAAAGASTGSGWGVLGGAALGAYSAYANK